MTEIIKYIFEALGVIIAILFVGNWAWHGLTVIIGPEDKPLIKFWTYGIKRFFNKTEKP